MKKIQLENDIFIYQFEANSDSLIGSNITAIFFIGLAAYLYISYPKKNKTNLS